MTRPARRRQTTTAANVRAGQSQEEEPMAITPTNYHRLQGSELRHAHGAKMLGVADESEKLSVTIVLRRRPDGPRVPEPDHYLRTPPAERPRMPQPAFAARYG